VVDRTVLAGSELAGVRSPGQTAGRGIEGRGREKRGGKRGWGRGQREFLDSYSLGFFLGPGLPRGLGKASPIWARVRLLPGFGPGMPFLRVPSVGTAGVEAASDPLSTEDAGGTGSAVEEEAEGDELPLGGSFLPLTGVLEKRLRRPGESLRMMIRLERSALLDRPFEGDGTMVLEAGMTVPERCARHAGIPGSVDQGR
jgi:hypothetical protein